MNKYGGPAFPSSGPGVGNPQSGMTLRDYFAGQVLFKVCAYGMEPEDAAAEAYEYADAMILERDKT